RPQQRGATITFILEAPLGWNFVLVSFGIIRQGCHLAGNRVVLLLAVRGHTGVDSGHFGHSEPPDCSWAVRSRLARGAASGQVPGIHKPAPAFQPTAGQIDIPPAACVAGPAGGQPRPPPRWSTACTARLTISLRVKPVEAA